ncbi:MAG: hypothetical protein EOP38_27055, partial [Rubrivivax sp.]
MTKRHWTSWAAAAAVTAACWTSLPSGAIPISNDISLSTTTHYALTGTAGSIPSAMTGDLVGPITAAASYGSDVDGSYLQLVLTNTHAKSSDYRVDIADPAAYVLHLGPTVTPTGTPSLFRLATKIKVLPQAGKPVGPKAHIYAGYLDSHILEQADSTADVSVNNRTQTLVTDFLKGGVRMDTGAAVTQLEPGLVVDNLLPGEQLTLRVYTASLGQYDIASNLIAPLVATQKVRSGMPLKLTVNLLTTGRTLGLSGAYNSEITLVSSTGALTVLGTRPVNVAKPATSLINHVVDPWQIATPSLANGTYTVRYRIVPSGNMQGVFLGSTSTSVLQTGGLLNVKGFSYDIGTVVVSSTHGGMHIGTSTHNYPYSYATPDVIASPGQTFGQSVYGSITTPFKMFRTNRISPWWTTSSSSSSMVVFDQSTYTRAYASGGTIATQPEMQLTLQDWANYFSPVATPKKNLLLVFWGMPYEASSDPTNIDNGFFQAGLAAPPSATGAVAYASAMLNTLNLYGDRAFALECGNEPDDRWFWSGTQAQLADSCKALWTARDASGKTNIPIICPQAASAEHLGYILSSKTTGLQEPISQFCDWIGTHVYTGMGNGLDGKPLSVVSLSEQIRLIRNRMSNWSVANKPLVITEFGIARSPHTNVSPFNGLALNSQSDSWKGNAVYQSIATLQEEGVHAVSLYSYDINTTT